MATLIVGVMGRKRSGKDTLAARLVLAHGFTRVGFADALRESALALDPFVETPGGFCVGGHGPEYERLSDVIAYHGWEVAKDSFPDVRRLLQRLGSDCVRDHIDREAWVKAAARKVDAIPGPVVIPDVRFANEVAYVMGHHRGYTVRVTRADLPDDGDLHVSETALDDTYADFTVHNNSTLDALDSATDRVALSL